MKTRLTLLFPVILSGRATGQLQADAGNDTIVCMGVCGVDTMEIRENPAETGGRTVCLSVKLKFQKRSSPACCRKVAAEQVSKACFGDS